MKPLLLSLLSAVILWANAHIFVYHRFNDSRYPSTNTTNAQLKKDFEYFKTHGYEVITLKHLVGALKSKKKISDKWVVLTIDDNFKSFYTNALAIFRDYNYPFSLFVYVEATQKRYHDYLSWEQLKEISKYGSLEFHSYSHGHMTKMSNKEIRKDFEKGLNLFQEKLNIKPNFFTYPYGEFNQRVKKIVMSYGFKAIINQNIGAVSYFSDVNNLNRIALVGKTNLPLAFKYKALDAKWIEPTLFPKDKKIQRVHVKTHETSTKGKIYISGYGWMDILLKDGKFDVLLNKKLKKDRSRIIVSVKDKISTKLLIKDSYGIK